MKIKQLILVLVTLAMAGSALLAMPVTTSNTSPQNKYKPERCWEVNEWNDWNTPWKVEEGAGEGPKGVTDVADDVVKWLGKDAKVITNKAGDKIFISKSGIRRIRFDINRPYPHSSPHVHVEELINGKWVKSGPIYPKGGPQKWKN